MVEFDRGSSICAVTVKGQLEAWFGRLLLGHLDLQGVSFLPADISPQTPELKNSNRELKQ